MALNALLLYLAKAYPQRAERKTAEKVLQLATIRLFRNHIRKVVSLTTLAKLSKVGAIGNTDGGTSKSSVSGLNDSTRSQNRGKLMPEITIAATRYRAAL